MIVKNSNPDWLTDMVTCDCALSMCPICDPDFYYDMSQEFLSDAPPPF